MYNGKCNNNLLNKLLYLSLITFFLHTCMQSQVHITSSTSSTSCLFAMFIIYIISHYYSIITIIISSNLKCCTFNHMPTHFKICCLKIGEGKISFHTLAMTRLRIEDEPRITHTRMFPSGYIDTPTWPTNLRVSLTHTLVCKRYTNSVSSSDD